MSEIRNRNVLVTGAASGIGKLLGDRVLREGAGSLAAWDIDESGLKEAAARWRSQGFTVHPHRVDVADTAQVIAAARQVRAVIGRIDILINNAGVVVGRTFADHSHSDIDFTIGINTTAPMHVTLELLPDMIRNRAGHIVNMASAAGMVANPKMSVYAASKWAVIGWSESLRLELERIGSNLHVTTVTPYYINTGMFAGVRSVIPILNPEPAADKIIRGIRRNSIFVRIPNLIHILPVIRGILPPRAFDFLVGKLLGVYRSMDHFTGKK